MPSAPSDKAGMSGPPPNGGYHQPPPYGGQPPHFQQPPYGGPPGQFPSNGYMGWQGGQQQQPPPGYGGWQGQGHPPMGMYRQGGPGGPPPGGPPNGAERGYGGYRGGPPRRGDQSPPRKGAKQDGYWGGGGGGGGGGQQWPQHQWNGGPPPPPHGWQGGPPPMQQPGPSPPPNMPQHMQGPPKMWPGGRNAMTSPGRPGPRRSPETMPMMGGPSGYPPRMNGMDMGCQPVGRDPEDDMYMGRDDKKSSMMSDKDKGRGSYRCGRCGAPKKGHVCPYQPKLKRRPDEPPPEMRNAALQVEMDEFMTLRRLNIEIQGFPESYATAPLMADNMVVGEPHPYALGGAGVVTSIGVGEPPPPPMSETPDMLRSSPVPSPSPVVEPA